MGAFNDSDDFIGYDKGKRKKEKSRYNKAGSNFFKFCSTVGWKEPQWPRNHPHKMRFYIRKVIRKVIRRNDQCE